VALTLIKAAHTLAWLPIESCMAYVLYACEQGAARAAGEGQGNRPGSRGLPALVRFISQR
jgi:hypothetical protein